MIRQECKRRNTDFSSFMRAAALGAMRNRTYHRGNGTYVQTLTGCFQSSKLIASRCDHRDRTRHWRKYPNQQSMTYITKALSVRVKRCFTCNVFRSSGSACWPHSQRREAQRPAGSADHQSRHYSSTSRRPDRSESPSRCRCSAAPTR